MLKFQSNNPCMAFWVMCRPLFTGILLALLFVKRMLEEIVSLNLFWTPFWNGNIRSVSELRFPSSFLYLLLSVRIYINEHFNHPFSHNIMDCCAGQLQIMDGKFPPEHIISFTHAARFPPSTQVVNMSLIGVGYRAFGSFPPLRFHLILHVNNRRRLVPRISPYLGGHRGEMLAGHTAKLD